MATITATGAQAGIQPKGLSVGLVAWARTHSVGASLSVGDVIQMIKVPKGSTPVYVALSGGSGQGVVKVGDGISPGRYLAGYLNSSGRTLTPINTVYVPYTYTTDDTIDILASLVSTGTAAGAFSIIAIMTMNP